MKHLYIFLGSISLFLAILGIVLPILPTTPFLLLTAALYLRGSEKLYHWLMNQPKLGPYIRNFQLYKAIPIKTKIGSVSMLWVTILISVIFVVPLLWVKLVMIGIALVVTIHILSYKTLK